MPGKQEFKLVTVRWLVALALLAASLWLGQEASVVDGADGALTASFTVLPSDEAAYGASVHGCENCLWPENATGKPDGLGAALWHNGELRLALAQTVVNSGRIRVWLNGAGLGPSLARIYYSADGEKWKHAGNVAVPPTSTQVELTGRYGEVRFVRIARSGWAFGVLWLDALAVDGGG